MTNQNRSYYRKVEFLLLIVVLIWAANYPVAKYGLLGLNALVFNSIRFITAAVVLGVPFLRGSRWTSVERADISKLLRAGGIASVIYQVAFIIGLSMTTAGNSAILLSTSPLWTIFLNARMHKEKIQAKLWTGMVISLCGVLMIVIGSGRKLAFGGSELFGDIIILTAAALWGLNINLQKPLLIRYSPMQLSFVLVVVGAVGLSVIAIPSAMAFDWGSIHWTYYLAAIISGAFSIGIGNTIWSRGVQQLGPGPTANFNNLVPVLAFVISYFTLHETVLPIQFIGAGVTIIGVWTARK